MRESGDGGGEEIGTNIGVHGELTSCGQVEIIREPESKERTVERLTAYLSDL